MSYMENVAPKRENPVSDRILEAAGPKASGSNQERQVGQSAKFRTVSTASKAEVGNQVRVQGNSKGTGVVGRPSSIALEGRKIVKGAVENPDGQDSRSPNGGGVKAAGRK